MTLADKKCIPCKDGTAPMPTDQAKKLLPQLNSTWKFNDANHLEAAYTFKTFHQALQFANKVGDLADEQGHHPDLYISWGKCNVEIWTHKIQGLSESDFILSAKIDLLA